jgi:peptidylprolyl isomerase
MKHLLISGLAIATLLAACSERQPPPVAPVQPAQPIEPGPATPQEARAPQPGEQPLEPLATPAVPPTAPPQAAPPAPTPVTPAAPPAERILETIETDSGLIIEELRYGTGNEARAGDTVVVHYHGTLADGRIFDSTYAREAPQTINVFETIPAWREGIPGMRVGGKRRLIVPPELGYGRRGTSTIPPNAMLIFEIELVEIVR